MCDAQTRRILTFPAIRPCESASPATLLSSLITLSDTISLYKTKPFYSNAQNAKDSLRLVGNILVFLEEIRRDETGAGLSWAMILSLSELHYVFQKLRFLLEDCTKPDARMWMLTRSEKVANQFRAIFRSISVALDVLPLDSVDVSIESKELVGLLKTQALNSKLGFRPEDQQIVEQLRSVLDQLEHQMVPDRDNLKRVLDYLGIWSWSECNKEIKFLDSELGSERSTTKKSDLGILSSLMGLMIYSRCTVFTTVDGERFTIPGECHESTSGRLVKSLNVDDFRCPISLEIMSDPVTLTTGHTYDRSSIEKWFRSGNLTCPKTGEKVNSRNLVSNLCIRSIIKQYCHENGVSVSVSVDSNRSRDTADADTGGSVAAEAAIKLAVEYLVDRLVFGTNEVKHKATYEIRLLSKTSVFNRACLVEAGVVSSLVDLLCVKNPKIQENAIAALLNLSKYSKTKKVLVENGGLELILEVAQNGLKMEARQHAAGTLFYLASVDEYRDIIGKIPRSIPVLMELVLEGTDRGKKNALVAIFGLLMYPENHWKALAAGLVPLLVDLLRSPCQHEDLLIDSLAILATLAEKHDGTMAILSSGALHVILDVVSCASSRAAREYCVTLLLAMCINGGGDVVRVLVSNPTLMGPLYSLLTDAEEVALAESYIAISCDSRVGNAQAHSAFWARISERFHLAMNREVYRSDDALSGKWTSLLRECTRFNGIFNNAKTMHASGNAPFNVTETALATYKAKFGEKAFTHIQAWKVLHNNKKWEWQGDSGSQTSGSKRSEPEVPFVDLNDPIDVDEVREERRAQKRPIGRTKAKRQAQQQASPMGPPQPHVAEIVADKLGGKVDKHYELYKESIKKKDERYRDSQIERDIKVLGYVPKSNVGRKDLKAINKLKTMIRAKWNINDDDDDEAEAQAEDEDDE